VTLLDHIGIAVKDLDAAVKLFTEIIGLKLEGYETVKEQEVKIAFLSAKNTEVELITPLSNESPVAKFLEKRGEGLHHLAFRVKNLSDMLRRLKSERLQLIDKEPRKGARGRKIAFIHPKSTHGVLLELCEE
jgi:methylmalonyl-CoA/ethylmalonyl-CoA epimerase